MTCTWVTSDTHFGHAGICKFLRDDGTKVRPWDDPEEMTEALIENWNRVVGVKDRIYHLGDVVINRRYLKVLERLNGRKVLVKGNHDLFKLPDYLPHFDDIRGCWPLDNLMLTHIPIHPGSFEGRIRGNVHGHLHWRKLEDKRYFNACVEHTAYTPINFEEIRKYYDREFPGVLQA